MLLFQSCRSVAREFFAVADDRFLMVPGFAVGRSGVCGRFCDGRQIAVGMAGLESGPSAGREFQDRRRSLGFSCFHVSLLFGSYRRIHDAGGFDTMMLKRNA